jgi:hypothetical protein
MPLPPPPPDLPEGKLPAKIKKKGGFPSSLTGVDPDAEAVAKEWGEKKRLARADSNWKTIADVDWEDLEHFVARARATKDNADFDTCVRILEALRKQILNK